MYNELSGSKFTQSSKFSREISQCSWTINLTSQLQGQVQIKSPNRRKVVTWQIWDYAVSLICLFERLGVADIRINLFIIIASCMFIQFTSQARCLLEGTHECYVLFLVGSKGIKIKQKINIKCVRYIIHQKQQIYTQSNDANEPTLTVFIFAQENQIAVSSLLPV